MTDFRAYLADMSALSDPPAPTAWPAARPTGISPIQHPAWEEARNAILDLAAEGPVTAIIVGEPGTGKTWLLRELAGALGDHGFPTMMLMQGDLPMTLSDGAALLVDEASLMDEATRAYISAQRHGVAVLAALEWSEQELDVAAANPVIIRLRTLQPGEIAAFAAEWLQRSGLPDSIISAGMLSGLAARSGGRVGTIVQLLREAALPSETSAAASPEIPAEPPITALIPRRRSIYRPVLAASAIAATIALGWAVMPVQPPAKIAQMPARVPSLAAASPAATTPLPQLREADTPHPAETVAAEAAPVPLPPPQHAEIPGPALVTASTPAQPSIAAPPLVPALTPQLDAATAPGETEASVPAIAAAPPPPVLTPPDPTVVATLDDPASTTTEASPRRALPNRAGRSGLVLVAQRGDTLESLYGSVYRDRRAPPFATVLAANPGPFKPGAIVVFPEPPGGWQRIQR